MGLIAFRLRGAYFAIGTWVLAEVVSMRDRQQLACSEQGTARRSMSPATDLADRLKFTYWFALAIGVGSIVVAYIVLRSRLGLADAGDPRQRGGSTRLGRDVYRTRFMCGYVAAFVTAFAGAVFYLSHLRVQPTSSFSVVQWTAPIIFIVVIGGFGTIEGPIIGAVLYWWFKNQFIDHATWYSTTIGLIAILVAMWLQRGIWGIVRDRFDFSLLSVGRRLDMRSVRGSGTGASDPGR